MVDVLDKLIRMEVVGKKAPINDEHNKKKMGYYIIDNVSRFYYRKSASNILSGRTAWDKFRNRLKRSGNITMIYPLRAAMVNLTLSLRLLTDIYSTK